MVSPSRRNSIILICAAILPDVALAYVGPGAGITMLAALWAVILAILATIGAVLFWPIRAMLRKRRNSAAGTHKKDDEESADPESLEPNERPN